MITADDIAAFEPEQVEQYARDEAESIGQALEYARRAEKGLPADRYGSVRQMILAARGIKAMATIIGMQTAIIQAHSHDNG